MNKITETLLGLVSDWKGVFKGAYNIREDGACAGRQSSEHIQIESKEGAPGLVIHIAPEAQNETVYIPACVTHSDVNDLVYNDFYVGEGAHVTIVAGCGVHSDGEEEARTTASIGFLWKKAHMYSIRKSMSAPVPARVSAALTRSATSIWPRTLYWKWIRCRLAALTVQIEKPLLSWQIGRG